jgi:hypothetical protein
MLLTQTPSFVAYAQVGLESLLKSGQPSQNKLCSTAKLSTVKVLGGTPWGSGILVKKHGSRYSVVTNGHVLAGNQERYTVETYDGKAHQAFVLVRFDHSEVTGNDLVILQFDSSTNYEVATLAKWAEEEKVMAAGFPVNPDSSVSDPQGFMCSELASVSRKLPKPMQNGYQLGYLFSIPNGMSGGALFNEQGKVVGINGMGDPAIFTNPDIYLYRDGRRVSDSLGLPATQALDLLYSSSWAIPSETIEYLAPQGLNLTLDTSNTSSSSVPVTTTNNPIESALPNYYSAQSPLSKSLRFLTSNSPNEQP